MAVVQISRIQIRRGQANTGTGLPQLASGEMAWAIDTQELYIGNGAVSEGSPAVGNTKILTQNDLSAAGNLLGSVNYIYKSTDTTISTNPNPNNPVQRRLQDRLDDFVTAKEFGIQGGYNINTGTGPDDTAALQQAINQLFLNPNGAANVDITGTDKRIILQLPAGNFKITSTLRIPSYATIVGAGAEKTIIYYVPATPSTAGPAMLFINDSANPTNISQTSYTNQPKYISISGLTLHVTTGQNIAMQLDAVRDSTFENINLVGDWLVTSKTNVLATGILMRSLGITASCENNVFNNIRMKSFYYAVFAEHDILNNTFSNCVVGGDGADEDIQQGFVLGYHNSTIAANQSITVPSPTYGPRATTIINSRFTNIKTQGVFVNLGFGNTVTSCKFDLVATSDVNGLSPEIYFAVNGNTVKNTYSDRSVSLRDYSNITTPYIPELGGHGVYESFGTNSVAISQRGSETFAFRLPCPSDQYGNPVGNINYEIDYLYSSTNFSRKGSMTLSVLVRESGPTYTATTQLSDEYNFSGTDSIFTPSSSTATQLDFQSSFLDQIGNPYTGSAGQIPSSVVINYTNNLAGDNNGYFEYSYTAIS
jgi:hypothetical protein